MTTWRTCKKLGTYLYDSAELQRRYTLARAGFHHLWFRDAHVAEATRLRIYYCYVITILTYNCGIWALTKTLLLRVAANCVASFVSSTPTDLQRRAVHALWV
ncbi:hypothetical protein DYB37_011100 [Aphanomyces astaci]|uniref:Uncharacterized protein n=1 Tax=Aphanomyces astaci TaxID=112090 RepID=A0A418FTF6_APHAT|nr:hypothetical protein DYB37_011100 [Aphanomyces astaci]